MCSGVSPALRFGSPSAASFFRSRTPGASIQVILPTSDFPHNWRAMMRPRCDGSSGRTRKRKRETAPAPISPGPKRTRPVGDNRAVATSLSSSIFTISRSTLNSRREPQRELEQELRVSGHPAEQLDRELACLIRGTGHHEGQRHVACGIGVRRRIAVDDVEVPPGDVVVLADECLEVRPIQEVGRRGAGVARRAEDRDDAVVPLAGDLRRRPGERCGRR